MSPLAVTLLKDRGQSTDAKHSIQLLVQSHVHSQYGTLHLRPVRVQALLYVQSSSEWSHKLPRISDTIFLYKICDLAISSHVWVEMSKARIKQQLTMWQSGNCSLNEDWLRSSIGFIQIANFVTTESLKAFYSSKVEEKINCNISIFRYQSLQRDKLQFGYTIASLDGVSGLKNFLKKDFQKLHRILMVYDDD